MTVAAAVYLPTAADGHQEVADSMSSAFGGYSRVTVEGGWVADNGQIIEERTFKYESVTSVSSPTAAVRMLATWLSENTQETAVLWEIRPITKTGME